MSKNILYLVDGTSICYRSFFALKLSTSQGIPTGAVYGFYQTIKKLISRYKPPYLGICFDVSRKTFRQEKFKEYKLQRPPIPNDLKEQIPLIKELIRHLGLFYIEKEGFEADDIIASLVKRARDENWDVVIVTSDKDLYQLLEKDKVKVYNPVGEEFLDEDGFIKEFGFEPVYIVDYLSLTGDSADNIPGAKGIGKVGASKLIKSFKSIENIFSNIDGMPFNQKELLSKNKESIFLSKELVKLHHPDLSLTWEDLKIKEADNISLYKMFTELEFKKLLKDIPVPSLDLKMELQEGLPADIKEGPIVFFAESESVYVFKGILYKVNFLQIKSYLEDNTIEKISYDFKKQISFLKDAQIRNIKFDVGLAAYLIDPSGVDYNMETLVSHYMGDVIPHIPPAMHPYFISRLYELFSLSLKENNLEELFFEVEMPLIYVLYDMEKQGVNIDLKVIKELLGEVEEELKIVQKDIFDKAGRDFNLNSPKQLGEVLFTELRIPPVKKTKTGYSTGEEILEKLAGQYPIAESIIEYRYLNKLKTTYIIPLIEEVESKGGRLHSSFNQTATQTGRLSSSSPNLQSIPTKGRFSSRLRKAFISSFKDGYILSADYSQIELRILAHFSGDERLIEAFKEELDIHVFTASLLFGIKEQDIKDQQRDLAKRVNFGIIYGMSAYGLSRELNISPSEAEVFIADYFLRYPGVKNYINRIYEEVRDKGFVRTLLGRKRNLPDFNSSNPRLKELAQRQAINTPIQGSCADIIKTTMVRIYKVFKEKNLKTKLIIQIHDDLVFDVHGDEIREVKDIVKTNMEEAFKLKVPLKVNLKAGGNWAEMTII